MIIEWDKIDDFVTENSTHLMSRIGRFLRITIRKEIECAILLNDSRVYTKSGFYFIRILNKFEDIDIRYISLVNRDFEFNLSNIETGDNIFVDILIKGFCRVERPKEVIKYNISFKKIKNHLLSICKSVMKDVKNNQYTNQDISQIITHKIRDDFISDIISINISIDIRDADQKIREHERIQEEESKKREIQRRIIHNEIIATKISTAEAQKKDQELSISLRRGHDTYTAEAAQLKLQTKREEDEHMQTIKRSEAEIELLRITTQNTYNITLETLGVQKDVFRVYAAQIVDQIRRGEIREKDGFTLLQSYINAQAHSGGSAGDVLPHIARILGVSNTENPGLAGVEKLINSREFSCPSCKAPIAAKSNMCPSCGVSVTNNNG